MPVGGQAGAHVKNYRVQYKDPHAGCKSPPRQQKGVNTMDTEKDYSQYYNKGYDCDICAYQYLCGRDGDATGCRRYDEGLECKFDEVGE